MTEAEWLECSEPTQMWWFVENRVSDRKLRLVACACCRRIWQLLSDPSSKPAVQAAERLADGLITTEQAKQLLASDVEGLPRALEIDNYSVARSALIPHPAVTRAVPSLAASLVEGVGGSRGEEAKSQTMLLRCIFGNPFRPVALDPGWRTSTVVALAEGVYEDRAFDRLPILADALQDAGCDNEEVLAHCHGAGPHARGCWVVDLILGKS